MKELESLAVDFEAEPQGIGKTGDSIPDPNRVHYQTDDEWLREFDTGVPVIPANRSVEVSDRSSLLTINSDKQDRPQLVDEPRLKFIGHRTAPIYDNKGEKTIKATLILEFANVDTGDIAAAHFNVDTRRLRGKYKGTAYRLGDGGQFNPGGPKSKFQRFWMQAVGQAPRRWSRAHHEMHRLKDLIFTADLKSARKRGGTYTKAENLKRIAQ